MPIGDRDGLGRNRTSALVVLTLGLVAIIILASTFARGELVIETSGSLPDIFEASERDPPETAPITCPWILNDWRVFGGVIGLFGSTLVIAFNTTILDNHTNGSHALIACLVGGPIAAGWALFCEPIPPIGATLGGAPAIGTVPVEEVLLGSLVVASLLFIGIVIAWLLYRPAPGAPGPETGSAELPPDASLASIGTAAGAIADQLEADEPDVDNLVYAAWREMVTRVPVKNPQSCSPQQFADAAIELGMHPEDVAELTALFEEVRYGERDAARRESRAITVLRRIETTYGATEDDP